MPAKKGLTIVKVRSAACGVARLLGDVQAVSKGPKATAKRIARRVIGKALGRMLGKLLG